MTDPIVVELPNGMKVTVSSAAQALEIAQGYPSEKARPDKRKLSVNGASHSTSWPYPADEAEMALRFLNAIRNAGADGADSEKIMKAVEVTEGRGVGGRAVMINGMLRHLGFNPDSVYDNARTSEGRFWKARSKLDEAAETIRRRAAEKE